MIGQICSLGNPLTNEVDDFCSTFTSDTFVVKKTTSLLYNEGVKWIDWFSILHMNSCFAWPVHKQIARCHGSVFIYAFSPKQSLYYGRTLYKYIVRIIDEEIL